MYRQIIWDKGEQEILFAIGSELESAEAKFPDWPSDPVHAAAILAKESGELTQAALDFYYHREEDVKKMRTEAIHTAAMAMRFLKGIACEPSHLQQDPLM